jgi:hypothetical protein
MQKECLVKNWMKISNDRQDAVAKPGREGAAEPLHPQPGQTPLAVPVAGFCGALFRHFGVGR